MENNLKQNYETYNIGNCKLHISKAHRFGTDALALAKFATPKVGTFKQGSHYVDLCTGCGIIPIAMFQQVARLPEMTYAVDIANEAIELLKTTIAVNKLTTIIAIHSDLNQLNLPMESIDLITANPPYYKAYSGKIRVDSQEATARHELNCTVNDIAITANKLLKYGGVLKICIVPDRLVDVFQAFRIQKIEPKKLILLNNINKPWLALIEGKKGAKSGLIVENVETNLYLNL